MSIFRWHTVASPHPLLLYFLSFQQLSMSICCCINLFIRHELCSFASFLTKTTIHLCNRVLENMCGLQKWRGRLAGGVVPIVNASVGLQTSDIVTPPHHHHQFICIPLSSTRGFVFVESDGSADSCCFFWGLGWSGRASPTQETVLKVERRKGNGWTKNLWFCLATKGGVQRKRDQSASAFRAEASCRSPVSLAKNKPWVETGGFLPSYLSASFSRLFHHPALLPFPAAEPQSKAAQSGGLTFVARGRKILPKHEHIY